jgi:hypothetical protein
VLALALGLLLRLRLLAVCWEALGLLLGLPLLRLGLTVRVQSLRLLLLLLRAFCRLPVPR